MGRGWSSPAPRNAHPFRRGLRIRAPFFVAAAVVAAALVAQTAREAAGADFRRGDSNTDGRLDVSDALLTFGWLFLGGKAPACLDAADSDDSGVLDLTDGVFGLNYLFLGGPAPPPPGASACGPDPTGDALSCEEYPAQSCDGTGPGVNPRAIGHVLNRLGYGPTRDAAAELEARGLTAYIQEQLSPETIDESGNAALSSRLDALFDVVVPAKDTPIIQRGAEWRYAKGTVAPQSSPTPWTAAAFDDSTWLSGPTGIGYGDGDDATVLADMQGAYVSVYLRKKFSLSDLSAVEKLIFRVDYDDGFVAYLNGAEIARRGLAGNPPPHTATATSHEAGTPEEIDVTDHKAALVAGDNVLAIQAHNSSIDSGDFSIIPELLSRRVLPLPPRKVIKGTEELQGLLHVRGIYSRRQLQAVLAEFWENHFTTDAEKVAEYLDSLRNSDGTDAMTQGQARAEAAQLEYEEYEFFYENALGNFGDLLLFSATSPTMLIYLDGVLNVVGNANENYAREIFELHAFGVDNRYTQRDIEQLARCFTGWTICKVSPEEARTFPLSATNPPIECGVQFEDRVLVELGPGWKYRKGLSEPSPAPGTGAPTIEWTSLGFDDSAWTDGSTGIGYGDDDDATRLTDMRGNYASVYLRRRFSVADPSEISNLILEARYDDGFVAYLNGVEVARSRSMENTGTPPAHDALARDSHEVTEGAEISNLNSFRALLAPGANVLAIEVHNAAIDSSDLSMLPRLLDRRILPGSVEAGDPTGRWTFRFVPALHDVSAKTILRGTPQEYNVPAGRTGPAGLADALDFVRGMADHPSTAEFISIKLIQRFVSDDITLAGYRAGTAPPELTALLSRAIAAWNSTSPRGNIRTVLEAILDPVGRSGEFWNESRFGSKVKTPIEFVNSTARALDASVSGTALRAATAAMGMHFFTRDDPDGWSELGLRWIDTSSMLARIGFAQAAAENSNPRVQWDSAAYLASRGIATAEEIVDYFGGFLFQGTLAPAERELLLEFLETDADGRPSALVPGTAAYRTRVQEFVGLLLSLPRWQFQ
ncbi:MAG: DUF1800 family protein [Planctomycetota bacterium]